MGIALPVTSNRICSIPHWIDICEGFGLKAHAFPEMCELLSAVSHVIYRSGRVNLWEENVRFLVDSFALVGAGSTTRLLYENRSGCTTSSLDVEGKREATATCPVALLTAARCAKGIPTT